MPTSASGPNLDQTYYDATAGHRIPYPALKGGIDADVCIIGGGIAGCSTALRLVQRGLRVVLVESGFVGSGASGRNGGQIIPGFAADQDKLIDLVGRDDATHLWKLSVAAIDLLRELIDTQAISCDWTPGHLQVAIKARQHKALRTWHETVFKEYGYTHTRLLNGPQVRARVASARYCGGLHDDKGGHLHPLKYVRGLAAAAAKAGVQIFENSAAIDVSQGAKLAVKTREGTVRASHAVLCCGAYLGNSLGNIVAPLQQRIMPVTTYVIATEPLGEERAAGLISDNSAVSDSNFILDYFRRSADHRLIFGGRVNYSGHRGANNVAATRRHMLRVFPQMADIKIEFAWEGLLDITLNRAPDFGRIGPNCYYLQGFSGHGVALATMAGTLVADAVLGDAERFDIFSRIAHRNFPGGAALRTPALTLAMLWYRLRDLL